TKRQQVQNALPTKHDYEAGQRGPVDRIEKKDAAGPQHTADLVKNMVEVLDVLEDVDAYDAIDASARQRQILARGNEVADWKPPARGMPSRDSDCTGRRIDADNLG